VKPLTSVIAMVGAAVLSGCSLFQWAMPGVTLSDANVLAMLDTINIDEIDAAKLAQQKAFSEKVRTFAARMLNDHKTMMLDTRQLAQRIHVKPERPALASTTGKTHQKTMGQLRMLSGRAFDQAYLKYQITTHEQAIDLVQDIADSVDNSVLQQHLIKTRPDLENHLSKARALERQVIATS
jgi:putative membrane protein